MIAVYNNTIPHKGEGFVNPSFWLPICKLLLLLVTITVSLSGWLFLLLPQSLAFPPFLISDYIISYCIQYVKACLNYFYFTSTIYQIKAWHPFKNKKGQAISCPCQFVHFIPYSLTSLGSVYVRALALSLMPVVVGSLMVCQRLMTTSPST